MEDTNIFNTEQFKQYDNIILDNFNNKTQISIHRENNIFTWYKKYKKKSDIYNRLDKHKIELDKFGFTIDDAIKCICTLLNYTYVEITNKDKTYFKIPERLLCYRVECGRERLRPLMYVLNKTKIIDMQFRNNSPVIKLDIHLVNSDDYIKLKIKKFRKWDCDAIDIIRKKYGSFYYLSYNSKVQTKKETELYMGFILAYNMMWQNNERDICKI